MNIEITQLDSAISEILSGYDAEARDAVKRAVSKTAKATNAEIKRHVTFKSRTGKYVDAFALKKVSVKKTVYSEVWHVKPPGHRIAHLLENGHMNRDGSRTKAFPHIIYGEKLARGMLPDEIEKELSE